MRDNPSFIVETLEFSTRIYHRMFYCFFISELKLVKREFGSTVEEVYNLCISDGKLQYETVNDGSFIIMRYEFQIAYQKWVYNRIENDLLGEDK